MSRCAQYRQVSHGSLEHQGSLQRHACFQLGALCFHLVFDVCEENPANIPWKKLTSQFSLAYRQNYITEKTTSYLLSVGRALK